MTWRRFIEHSKPTVTIFADASAYPASQQAGWGGWGKSDSKGSWFNSGPLSYNKDMVVLELQAIEQMLITSSSAIQADRSFIIQSDCLFGLQVLLGVVGNTFAAKVKKPSDSLIRPANGPRSSYRDVADRIGRLLSHADVIYLRHVKAHRNDGNERSWVNEKCDKLAKAAAQASSPL